MKRVNNFNFRLKELREKKGLNQEQIAAELSKRTGTVYSRSQVSQYETCKVQPRLELIPILMEILDVSAEALLGLPEHENKDNIIQHDITHTAGVKRRDVKTMSKPDLKLALSEMYDLADDLIQDNIRLKDDNIRLKDIVLKSVSVFKE